MTHLERLYAAGLKRQAKAVAKGNDAQWRYLSRSSHCRSSLRGWEMGRSQFTTDQS